MTAGFAQSKKYSTPENSKPELISLARQHVALLQGRKVGLSQYRYGLRKCWK
jgi:hypothetical protein